MPINIQLQPKVTQPLHPEHGCTAMPLPIAVAGMTAAAAVFSAACWIAADEACGSLVATDDILARDSGKAGLEVKCSAAVVLLNITVACWQEQQF
jgi:hypothetical protein